MIKLYETKALSEIKEVSDSDIFLKESVEMDNYCTKIRENENDSEDAITDNLLRLFFQGTWAQRQTFIWILHPDDTFFVGTLKKEKKRMLWFNDKLNIDTMIGRPVFYSLEEGREGYFIFRAYK